MMHPKLTCKTALASAILLALAVPASANQFNSLRHADHIHLRDTIPARQAMLSTEEADGWLIVLNASPVSQQLLLPDSEQQQAQQRLLQTQQDVMQLIKAHDPDAMLHTTTRILAAGLVVSASADAIEAASLSNQVDKVLPLFHAKPHAVDSAAAIGASQLVQAGTATGQGIRIAVLDSGIDYTHQLLGGAGTEQAYLDAVSHQNEPAWPIGSVIGGFNFMEGHPNPIDTNGHGTFVAHAALAAAPDAELYAYTVCDSTCPFAAQIGGIEAAMDPTGSGTLTNRADIINLSLGGEFGSTQTISGTQYLLQRAADLGVLVVASAGNDGNVPFRIAGPSTTPNALSVGAMTHPTLQSQVLVESSLMGESIAAEASSFNPAGDFEFTDSTAPLTLVPGNELACDAVDDNLDLTDQAVLVFRGDCTFTQKVVNAQTAGASLVVLANNVPGEAPFSAGGSHEAITIPSLMITLEDGIAIQNRLAEGLQVDYRFQAEQRALSGAVANFSSRGPAMDGLLKPEITAPGQAIEMAAAGTQDGVRRANGTSFSAPLVSGAAALLRELHPERTGFEIKATLMNTADLNVSYTPKALDENAAMAPVSLMGAGMVNVEKAAASPVAAWVHDSRYQTRQAALAFGLQPMQQTSTLVKQVTLKNFSQQARSYQLSMAPRDAAKPGAEALSWDYPASVQVGPLQSVQFEVALTVDPSQLPEFALFNMTRDPASALDAIEFDGALLFNDTSTAEEHDLHLVYHIIPKANSNMQIGSEITDDGTVFTLHNQGATAIAPVISNLVRSHQTELDTRHGIRSISLHVEEDDWCTSGYSIYPSFHLADGWNHMLQGHVGIDFDVTGDGFLDYTMMSLLATRLGPSYASFPGVAVTFTTPFAQLSGQVGDLYHFSGQSSVTLQACLEDIGLGVQDIGSSITARFRTDTNGMSLGPVFGGQIADHLITSVQILEAPEARLTNGSGDELASLQPGDTGYLQLDNLAAPGFVLIDAVGDAVATADLTAPMQAPRLPEQSFAIEENAPEGTLIGTLQAEVDFRAAIAEFVVLESSSNAIALSQDGRLTVQDSAALDYEAGLTSIQLSVLVVDSHGRVSPEQQVHLEVINVPDEQPIVTVTPAQTSVAAGAAPGTVLAEVQVEIREAYATLESLISAHPLFAISGNQLTLARMPSRNDAGNHQVVITATDSSGMQGQTTVNVEVTRRSGGSLGWFSLLLLPLLWLRRRS
ncbi:MAG: S8 family serine peptidase [Alkalimonas sp.]|nr:S8 family serine peptidase [Alkalimonas sp.]